MIITFIHKWEEVRLIKNIMLSFKKHLMTYYFALDSVLPQLR